MIIAATQRQIETAIVMANKEIHILRSPSRPLNRTTIKRDSSHRSEFETPSASRKPWTATPSIFRSDNLVKRFGDALLDRLSGLDCHFLGECQKLLILRGDRVELLAR